MQARKQVQGYALGGGVYDPDTNLTTTASGSQMVGKDYTPTLAAAKPEQAVAGLARGGKLAGDSRPIPGKVDPTVADDITINAKKGEFVLSVEDVALLGGADKLTSAIKQLRKQAGLPTTMGPKRHDEPDMMGRMDKPGLKGIAGFSSTGSTDKLKEILGSNDYGTGNTDTDITKKIAGSPAAATAGFLGEGIARGAALPVAATMDVLNKGVNAVGQYFGFNPGLSTDNTARVSDMSGQAKTAAIPAGPTAVSQPAPQQSPAQAPAAKPAATAAPANPEKPAPAIAGPAAAAPPVTEPTIHFISGTDSAGVAGAKLGGSRTPQSFNYIAQQQAGRDLTNAQAWNYDKGQAQLRMNELQGQQSAAMKQAQEAQRLLGVGMSPKQAAEYAMMQDTTANPIHRRNSAGEVALYRSGQEAARAQLAGAQQILGATDGLRKQAQDDFDAPMKRAAQGIAGMGAFNGVLQGNANAQNTFALGKYKADEEAGAKIKSAQVKAQQDSVDNKAKFHQAAYKDALGSYDWNGVSPTARDATATAMARVAGQGYSTIESPDGKSGDILVHPELASLFSPERMAAAQKDPKLFQELLDKADKLGKGKGIERLPIRGTARLKMIKQASDNALPIAG